MNSPKLLTTVVRTLSLFDKAARIRFFLIMAFMFLASFLELLNVGLFFPLIQLVIEPSGESLAGPFSGFLKDSLANLNIEISTTVVVGVLVTVFVSKNLLLILITYWRSFYTAKILGKMTTQLTRAFAQKPYEDLLRLNSAHAVYDISVTAPSAVGTVMQSVFGTIMEVMLAAAAAMALAVIAPLPAAIAAGFVIFALWLFFAFSRAYVARLTRVRQALSRDINRWAHACLGSHKEAAVLNRLDYFIDNIDKVTQIRARFSAKLGVINESPRIYGEVVAIGALLLTAAIILDEFGAFETAMPFFGVFAIAAFRAFPSANRVTHHALALKQAGEMLDHVYGDLSSAISVEVEKSRSDKPNGIILSSRIRFESVSYRYPDATDWTLKDLTFEINRGEAIGLVGPSGSGKSTLIDILLGLLPPQEGAILIDGESPRDPVFWRGRAGYVPQEVFLLDESICRNIAIGIPDAEIDKDEVMRAIAAARLTEVLKSQSQGIDTVIGERGIRLSGGQRQRIGIARALYNNPDLLVFDEATSALDSQTEREITRAIHDLKGTKTLIIIAHRLSTVRECDRLIFLNEGRIVDIGSFEELQARNTDFANLVQLSDIGGNGNGETDSTG